MYQLYMANRNYSSWSLRPWVLLSTLGIPFSEHELRFGDAAAWARFRQAVPGSGQVPTLVDGDITVWDSLAIMEYLSERHPGVWPPDRRARAWARSAAAEMHSGFRELRIRCSMSCGVRIRLHEHPPELARDIARLVDLWTEGLNRFGGPFLAGSAFCAVDAYYAPVAFRVQSYGLQLNAPAAAYAQRLLDLPAMRRWYEAALRENWRDEPHEVEMLKLGTVLEDLRTR